MTEEKLTVEEWLKAVRINACDSYSMAVMLAALLVAENDYDLTGKDPHQLLRDHMGGLSGFQAENAINLAKRVPVAELMTYKE